MRSISTNRYLVRLLVFKVHLKHIPNSMVVTRGKWGEEGRSNKGDK